MLKNAKKILVCLMSILALSSCDSKACDHSYGNWKTKKEPTCIVAGSKERTCTKCGHVDTATLPALGHNYLNDKCTVCGATK